MRYDIVMSKKLFAILTLVIILATAGSLFLSYSVTAQDITVEQLQAQIDELAKLRKLSENATAPLEKELDNLENKIESAQQGIERAKRHEQQVAANIEQREIDLAASYQILSLRVVSQYKRSRTLSPLLLLLASSDATRLTQELAYQQSAEHQDKQFIASIGAELEQLEADKVKLAADQERLGKLEIQLEDQASFFRKEIAGARQYQQQLGKQIAALSARQQEILSQKSGTFQASVGDVPLADDPASRPDYSPGFSPAFAAFSFGAPHFNGMSQYGAYGRAKSGQNVEDILRAYYGGVEIKKDYSTDINITVQGYGTVDIETYVKRIHEVPNSWADNGGMEALKAQAVAARSYALSVTNNGASSICATESCQVYKPSNKGGAWEEAVNATRGWVLVANGKPLMAKYASTSGGYQQSYTDKNTGHSTPAFWDTQRGREGWTSEAFEKIAGSPWFYKGWYKSRSGDACGRNHPWLNKEEMADILNAWVVLVKNGQSDDRVTPSGGCWSGNPYSIAELRDKANSMGGGYESVDGVQVTYGNNGTTAQLVFSTNRGSVTISGADFKKVFNLRAPGNISLKSNLFNVEQK